MTSPTTQVYVFQDFINGTDPLLLDGSWILPARNEWSYGGTFCTWPDQSSSNSQASFTYTFLSITEMRFLGFCQEKAPDIQVAIRDAAPYTTSVGRHDYYSQVFQISTQAGDVVTITNGANCCFDSILVVPTPKSHLSSDQTLLVDDSYERIQYTGSWEARTDDSWFFGGSNGATLMNTTHRTSTVGDTMRFPFSGTNVVVLGGKLSSQLGNFTISYAIDGGSTTMRSFITDGKGDPFEPNVQLVDTGPLPSGDHILTLTLAACFNQTLVIDHILYTPSFDTLASMPNTTIPSTGPLQTTGSSSAATDTATSSLTPTPAPATPIGAIVGGTVGGLCIFFTICALMFWCIRRRRGLQRSQEYSYARWTPQADTTSSFIAPYTLKSAQLPPPPPVQISPVSTTKPSLYSSSLSQQSQRLTMISSAISEPRTQVSEGPRPAFDPDELARRVNDLTNQVERLQSSTAPPAYEAND